MKSSSSKFILGGGISGLIFAYYNPEFKIISQDLGGRLNHQFFKNIIYLHHTRESEKFLQDIGVAYEKKTQLIHYSIDNSIKTDIQVSDKITLIRKKLNDDDFNPKDLALSTHDFYIPILQFSYSELIESLKGKVSFIEGKVIRITADEIITEDNRFSYSNIVSTLPANVFWKIYYKKEKNLELKSKPVTFVLCNKEPEHVVNKKYDMIYFVDDKQKYVRISKKPGERDSVNILYEFTGVYSREEVLPYLPVDSTILEHYVDYSGIIYSNKNNIPPKNVLFVGRFAKWEHSEKQQDVIREAKFDFDFRDIWNRQANFTKFHIDFNRLDDIEYKQQLTKDYLLHVQAELTEVLNEINYKHHKKQKKVNVQNIRTELIDVQKFLFNLMMIWQMDPESFFDVFNSKSDEVEEKLNNEFN